MADKFGRRHYLVSATHVSPRFSFDATPVRVSPSAGNPGYWYADGKLGCSKDYNSPETAIRAMFGDHACTITKIEEVQ